VVRLAHEHRVPVLARGGGLSYTGGLACPDAPLVVDTKRLNSIEIHAADRYVIVGAGATWEALSSQLNPLGLRTQLAGPVSGSASTVGGAVSQALPGSMEGVIGLEVVLADGTIARTGSWARAGTSAFHRQAGPDLTGLFMGDQGAHGIKSSIVLRLLPRGELAFASFAYADGAALIADLVRVQQGGMVTRVLALNRERGSQAAQVGSSEALSVAGAVAAASSSPLAALRNVAGLVKGRIDLARSQWTMHLTAEGESAEIAQARMNLARAICAPNAREIEDTVPRSIAARPYSIRSFLGPKGERWVPLHGIVPLSGAAGALAAIEAYLADAAPALAEHEIAHSMLMSTGGAFVTIEPMFLWMDELDPIHFAHLEARHRERFGGRTARPAARDEVSRHRDAIRAILESHGAVHVQMGRFYPHAERLDPGSLELLTRLRAAVDPDMKMNPGALGISK
jgi:D-lactate dehydrogenase (cytochrome)